MQKYVDAISASGLTIHDAISPHDPHLWIPNSELETLLQTKLSGLSLTGLPIRTRSKVAKQQVCLALGYPLPRSLKKIQPRFFGQGFDTYVQKSRNLQIWNEELAPFRRYVIIGLDEEDTVYRIKVVTGEDLAILDKTGTLTKKYQARLVLGRETKELLAPLDSDNVRPLVRAAAELPSAISPIDAPSSGMLLPISEVFSRLSNLIGLEFKDDGPDQERLRGARLHEQVCAALGYANYRDDGRFPDVRHQLLEVKLQTSPTIDLGMARPDSDTILNIPRIDGRALRYRDVRYAIFCGSTDGDRVTLTHFYLTTGERFFSRFPQFQGKTVNRKLQIPLPSDFFE